MTYYIVNLVFNSGIRTLLLPIFHYYYWCWFDDIDGDL